MKKLKILIVISVLLLIVTLMCLILKNKKDTIETVDIHTKKITKEEFLETVKERNGLSSQQAEKKIETITLDSELFNKENQKVESQYYEMVDRIPLTEETVLVGVSRVQVFVNSDEKLLGFGMVVMKDILVEGATMYRNADYEAATRQPEDTRVYVDVLGGLQFYTEKNINSEKIERLGKVNGQNLYNYLIDDQFCYTLSKLEQNLKTI